MKQITRLMVNDFKIMKLGFDFAGFKVHKKESLSFHHLIVPNRLNGPYEYWNGSIMVQTTSHDYLHLIENKDYDMFLAITSEMIDENIKGYLDIYNIRKIHDIMGQFEKEYHDIANKKGKRLIKKEYIAERVKFE